MTNTLNYIDENRDRFVEELKEFLRIPSVSANSDRAEDTRRAARFVAEEARRCGLENVEIMETDGYPVVYADWLHAEGKPTVLLYGHYDVQPAEPLHLWTTGAFEPTVREGENGDLNLYARGSSDDKGQVFLHLKSIEALMRTAGALPVNMKIIIEGEEEVGSPNLPGFLNAHRELLASDAVVISDTSMYDYGMPGITYGLRGLAYFELHVTGAKSDQHSGMFGGPVPNPINALCEMIAGMKDENGRITLPGFYDNVELSGQEREQLARIPFDSEKFKRMLDIPETVGEKGYSDLERLWARPTLDVCGIWGGYQGEGAKTVLPSKAAAKISMRLVAHQDYKAVGDQLRKFVKENTPPGVRAEVVELHGGPPALTPTDSAPVRAALSALEKAFGVKPFLIRSGGSIPIVADFEQQLGAPVVLMGFGLPDDNLHAPNEKMNLGNFHLGIKSAALFLNEYGNAAQE